MVSWIAEIESNYVEEVEHPPKIRKAPMTFRGIKSNKKCFDPTVIAIGPLHHGKPELRRMESFKVRSALKCAKKSNKTMQELYKLVKKKAIVARNCYVEDSEVLLDEEKFAKMMFLDGCFVLEFINSCVTGDRDGVNMKTKDMVFVLRDIMLLENQLPFEFLKALMKLRFKEGERKKVIVKFIEQIIEDGTDEENERCWKSCWGRKPDPEPKGDEEEEAEPFHLLELVRTKLVDVDEILKGSCYSFSSWRFYHSVTDLKSAGIHVKCSPSGRFSDITFRSGCLSGCLRLPPINIDDHTQSLLLNLVAWEACPDTPDDFGVSSYVHFMDTLIDHADDVKKLRNSGVILNGLGSDEQTAELFNMIGRHVLYDPEVFGDVRVSIRGYYNTRLRLWLAEWVDTHFRSPWAFVALIAAILALGLTLAQTVLSALQLKE